MTEGTVIVQIAKGDEVIPCYCRLIDFDGQLYAERYLPSQETRPDLPVKLPLEASRLEAPEDTGGAVYIIEGATKFNLKESERLNNFGIIA